MKTAYLLMRNAAHPARASLVAGLGRLGYEVKHKLVHADDGDLMVMWDRFGDYDKVAAGWQTMGRPLIVAGNGYLGHSQRGGRWFAMSLDYVNAGGRWPHHGPERWDSWDIELRPWRKGGEEAVVLPMRELGTSAFMQPTSWVKRMASVGRVRAHSGFGRQAIPLEDDLRRASHVVTWAHQEALRALLWGIPVLYDCPRWIGAPAASTLAGKTLMCSDYNRLEMFRRLAWAQYSLEEVESGYAYTCLLEANKQQPEVMTEPFRMMAAQGRACL